MENHITVSVILFVDGHMTHVRIEVSELCGRLNIHLIALYLNATRILQRADVAAKGVERMVSGEQLRKKLTKETFAPLLKTVLDSTILKETLINGFRVSLSI